MQASFIVEFQGSDIAIVELGGVRKAISIALVPEAQLGDDVIVPVGHAIGMLDVAIPLLPQVAAACELLGLDPMYIANEGERVAIVAPEAADAVLAAMHAHPLGRSAGRIGHVSADPHRRILSRQTVMPGSAGRFAALLLLMLALVVLAPGCAPQLNSGAAPAADAQATMHPVHVVRRGWHSGIVVRAADVPEQAWPARRDFVGAEHLEVGFGDRAYYQATDPPVWLGLRALLWPTAGVLQIVAFSGPVENHFASAEIVVLQITPQGFARLVAAISASHELDAAGRPIPIEPGPYGTSRFYASREAFHLFATCNVWIAAVLREAGVPVSPALSQTSGALFAQLRRHGQVIRPAP